MLLSTVLSGVVAYHTIPIFTVCDQHVHMYMPVLYLSTHALSYIGIQLNTHKAIGQTLASDNIDANIQKQLKTDINKVANNLVVGFSAENQKALLAKQAVIKENVGLIKSIPSELHDKIEFVLNQSILFLIYILATNDSCIPI